jgi:hypothetical protein
VEIEVVAPHRGRAVDPCCPNGHCTHRSSISSRSNSIFSANSLYLYGDNSTVTNVTMSFGFSVSDFITAIELANRIRKEFVGAPSQFKDISDELVVLADKELMLTEFSQG